MRLSTLDPYTISRQLYVCGGLCTIQYNFGLRSYDGWALHVTEYRACFFPSFDWRDGASEKQKTHVYLATLFLQNQIPWPQRTATSIFDIRYTNVTHNMIHTLSLTIYTSPSSSQHPTYHDFSKPGHYRHGIWFAIINVASHLTHNVVTSLICRQLTCIVHSLFANSSHVSTNDLCV
jgi:hypothetical protein